MCAGSAAESHADLGDGGIASGVLLLQDKTGELILEDALLRLMVQVGLAGMPTIPSSSRLT